MPREMTQKAASQKGRARWRRIGVVLAVLIAVLGAVRLALPSLVRDYVNRVLDQNQLYSGLIGDVRLHLWRGGYSIEDVRLLKTSGSVPVPFFAAQRVDLTLETSALMQGKLVGRIVVERPEINFVDAADAAGVQTGSGGPWLMMIRDLYPFRINSARVVDGTVHFRAFHTDPPVDLYLSKVEASIEDLTNIHDGITPMFSTVTATAVAMDQARVEYKMKLDPFSYRPTFQLALRLLGLDVTKTNPLARAYANLDFERGWFDLVVELDVKEGAMTGYIKPIFRDLSVFDLSRDSQTNVLATFWEALVGLATNIFKNHGRDQVATVVPLSGRFDDPNADMLATISNALRNAFVRAYLPKLQGTASEISGMTFEPGSVVGPEATR